MPSSRITRWLFKEKREFRFVDGRVVLHPQAFYPHETENALSVHDIEGMSEQEVWCFGSELFANKLPPSLKARADMNESDVSKCNCDLSVYYEIGPGEHERHRHIKNWPVLAGIDDDDRLRELKGVRDDKARALVTIATGVLKPG